MAFKEISGNVRYPKFAEFEEGDLIVEGKYAGQQEGKYGPQYSFNDEEGKVVLGKAGHLDFLMAQVSEGDTVRIEYGGQEILKSGAFAGKPAHRFKVLVDDDVAGDIPY